MSEYYLSAHTNGTNVRIYDLRKRIVSSLFVDLYTTQGLGHARILSDPGVIDTCLAHLDESRHRQGF